MPASQSIWGNCRSCIVVVVVVVVATCAMFALSMQIALLCPPRALWQPRVADKVSKSNVPPCPLPHARSLTRYQIKSPMRNWRRSQRRRATPFQKELRGLRGLRHGGWAFHPSDCSLPATRPFVLLQMKLNWFPFAFAWKLCNDLLQRATNNSSGEALRVCFYHRQKLLGVREATILYRG